MTVQNCSIHQKHIYVTLHINEALTACQGGYICPIVRLIFTTSNIFEMLISAWVHVSTLLTLYAAKLNILLDRDGNRTWDLFWFASSILYKLSYEVK